MNTFCPAHLVLIGLITLPILHEDLAFTIWTRSLRNFVHPNVTSSILDPNILLRNSLPSNFPWSSVRLRPNCKFVWNKWNYRLFWHFILWVITEKYNGVLGWHLVAWYINTVMCFSGTWVLERVWIGWFDLLTPYTHNSGLETITALLLICTLYSSPLHTH
jgi:hypothetical protein